MYGDFELGMILIYRLVSMLCFSTCRLCILPVPKCWGPHGSKSPGYSINLSHSYANLCHYKGCNIYI